MSKQLFADLVDVAVRLEKFGCDQFIVVHEGMLGKKGSIRHNWKDRYFVLCPPGCIFYMKSKENALALKDLRGPPRKLAEDGQKLCLGSIALIGFREKRPMTVAAIAEHHTLEFCFALTTPGTAAAEERVHMLSAASFSERLDWIDAVNKVFDFERRSYREKYAELAKICKEPFRGGKIICKDVDNVDFASIWQYKVIQDEDEDEAVVELIDGPTQYKGLMFCWAGDDHSGMVVMEGEDSTSTHGKGMWDGLEMRWQSNYRTSRGGGVCWSYRSTTRRALNKFVADDFTVQKALCPKTWLFSSPQSSGSQTIVSEGNTQPDRIPGKVRIEGSVPPPVALACAMFWAMRKELQYQADLFEKEKLLRMAIEQNKVKPAAPKRFGVANLGRSLPAGIGGGIGAAGIRPAVARTTIGPKASTPKASSIMGGGGSKASRVLGLDKVADEPKSPTASGRSQLTTPANAHQLAAALGRGKPLPSRPGGLMSPPSGGGRFPPPPVRAGRGVGKSGDLASPTSAAGGEKSLGAAIAELTRSSAIGGKPGTPGSPPAGAPLRPRGPPPSARGLPRGPSRGLPGVQPPSGPLRSPNAAQGRTRKAPSPLKQSQSVPTSPINSLGKSRTPYTPWTPSSPHDAGQPSRARSAVSPKSDAAISPPRNAAVSPKKAPPGKLPPPAWLTGSSRGLAKTAPSSAFEFNQPSVPSPRSKGLPPRTANPEQQGAVSPRTQPRPKTNSFSTSSSSSSQSSTSSSAGGNSSISTHSTSTPSKYSSERSRSPPGTMPSRQHSSGYPVPQQTSSLRSTKSAHSSRSPSPPKRRQQSSQFFAKRDSPSLRSSRRLSLPAPPPLLDTPAKPNDAPPSPPAPPTGPSPRPSSPPPIPSMPAPLPDSAPPLPLPSSIDGKSSLKLRKSLSLTHNNGSSVEQRGNNGVNGNRIGRQNSTGSNSGTGDRDRSNSRSRTLRLAPSHSSPTGNGSPRLRARSLSSSDGSMTRARPSSKDSPKPHMSPPMSPPVTGRMVSTSPFLAASRKRLNSDPQSSSPSPKSEALGGGSGLGSHSSSKWKHAASSSSASTPRAMPSLSLERSSTGGGGGGSGLSSPRSASSPRGSPQQNPSSPRSSTQFGSPPNSGRSTPSSNTPAQASRPASSMKIKLVSKKRTASTTPAQATQREFASIRPSPEIDVVDAMARTMETEIARRAQMKVTRSCPKCHAGASIRTCYSCGFSSCLKIRCGGPGTSFDKCPQCANYDPNLSPSAEWIRNRLETLKAVAALSAGSGGGSGGGSGSTTPQPTEDTGLTQRPKATTMKLKLKVRK